jgi:monolysocardiolipin acyltransferase
MLKSLAVQAKLLLSKSTRQEQEHIQYYYSINNSNNELTRWTLGRFDVNSISAPAFSSAAITSEVDAKQCEMNAADRGGVKAAKNLAHESEVAASLGHDGLLRTSIIWTLASLSRSFMGLNKTSVHGAENLELALRRPPGQALITVCNHVAAMDDPLVMSLIIPTSYYSHPSAIRWTLCATDRCFKFKSLAHLFTAAKVLPVQRGGGINQPGMMAAKERLVAGDWIHVFPEGTRSKDGVTLGPIRKGVGSLVAAAAEASSTLPPLVVPFYHRGMNKVMPRGQVLPSVGHEVSVIVGEPIKMDDLYQLAKIKRWSHDKLHTAIASRVSSHLEMLKSRLEAIESGSLDSPSEGLQCAATGAVSDKEIYDVSDAKRQADRRGGSSDAWKERIPSSSLFHSTLLQAPVTPARLTPFSWMNRSSNADPLSIFFNFYAKARAQHMSQFLSPA